MRLQLLIFFFALPSLMFSQLGSSLNSVQTASRDKLNFGIGESMGSYYSPELPYWFNPCLQFSNSSEGGRFYFLLGSDMNIGDQNEFPVLCPSFDGDEFNTERFTAQEISLGYGLKVHPKHFVGLRYWRGRSNHKSGNISNHLAYHFYPYNNFPNGAIVDGLSLSYAYSISNKMSVGINIDYSTSGVLESIHSLALSADMADFKKNQFMADIFVSYNSNSDDSLRSCITTSIKQISKPEIKQISKPEIIDYGLYNFLYGDISSRLCIDISPKPLFVRGMGFRYNIELSYLLSFPVNGDYIPTYQESYSERMVASIVHFDKQNLSLGFGVETFLTPNFLLRTGLRYQYSYRNDFFYLFSGFENYRNNNTEAGMALVYKKGRLESNLGIRKYGTTVTQKLTDEVGTTISETIPSWYQIGLSFTYAINSEVKNDRWYRWKSIKETVKRSNNKNRSSRIDKSHDSSPEVDPDPPQNSVDNGSDEEPAINSSYSDNIRIRVSESLPAISKVAVIGKESILCDGTKDDGQGLADLVEGELLWFYGVVERKHLEEILDEQRLAMSGLVLEDTDFANAGCLAGAQGTVLVSYGCLQDRTKLQMKLVDCSTSDLHWSATGLDVSEFDLLDALRSKLK